MPFQQHHHHFLRFWIIHFYKNLLSLFEVKGPESWPLTLIRVVQIGLAFEPSDIKLFLLQN